MRVDRPSHGGREAWREARSLADLCALAEAFLAGAIDRFPGWGAGTTDPETDEIVPHLVRLCRAGFLPCASQPARPDQRAFVLGFASRPVAERLTGVARDLDVRLFGLAGAPSTPEPVSRRDGRFHAFAGHDARAAELALFADEVGAGALAELRRAVWVSAFDPAWGREGRLWEELARVLEGA